MGVAALRENARDKAAEVFSKYHLGEPPIDIIELAEKLGYTVWFATFKDERISGGVSFDATQGGKIYVSRSETGKRQRFTVAQELGHCVMHRDSHKNGILESVDMFRRPDDHRPEEVEANEFAASILMPEEMVRQKWREWRSTEILADIFQVSISAMSYRLYNLDLKGDW